MDAHKGTIDLAAELGARGVVVHLGNSGARNLQKDIFEAIRAHPEMRAFIRWVRRKPPEFYVRTAEARSKGSGRR